MKPQKQTWDRIAKKWNQYRNIPSPLVREFLQDRKGKLLDLGCGSGRNFKKQKNLEIYGTDFSQKMIDFAKKKNIAKELKLMHNQEVPYPDNFFDSTICFALLHCIKGKQNKIKIIKEIYRTLKPSSQALVSVWGRKSPRIKNKPKECYVPWKVNEKELRYIYIYDKDELEKELTDVGFKITRSWEERNINVIIEK